MAAEGAHNSSGYILHHLTYLQLDLRTWQIVENSTGFWVLNLDSVFFSLLLAAIFLLMFHIAARKVTSDAPGKWQNFIEMCVGFVDSQVKDAYHHDARFVAPMALLVGAWVFFMNFMDLLPIDLLPKLAGSAGIEHLRVVPSADPNVALGMSITVFLIAFGYSFVAKGVKGVGAEFLFHPFGKWLLPVNFLLKCVEELAKPISLGLRLFGNMYAGEIIFILLACFTLSAPTSVSSIMAVIFSLAALILVGYLIARGKHKSLRVWLPVVIIAAIVAATFLGWAPTFTGAFWQIILATGWSLFHVLIILLQAYIFMVLTVVYMAMAADHH